MDDPAAEFEEAIDAAARGGLWLSPAARTRLSQQIVATHPDYVELGHDASLTNRQRQVLELVADGLSNEAIAACLHISLSTVRSHVRAVLRQTGCVNRHQLTAQVYRAKRRNIIS